MVLAILIPAPGAAVLQLHHSLQWLRKGLLWVSGAATLVYAGQFLVKSYLLNTITISLVEFVELPPVVEPDPATDAQRHVDPDPLSGSPGILEREGSSHTEPYVSALRHNKEEASSRLPRHRNTYRAHRQRGRGEADRSHHRHHRRKVGGHTHPFAESQPSEEGGGAPYRFLEEAKPPLSESSERRSGSIDSRRPSCHAHHLSKPRRFVEEDHVEGSREGSSVLPSRLPTVQLPSLTSALEGVRLKYSFDEQPMLAMTLQPLGEESLDSIHSPALAVVSQLMTAHLEEEVKADKNTVDCWSGGPPPHEVPTLPLPPPSPSAVDTEGAPPRGGDVLVVHTTTQYRRRTASRRPHRHRRAQQDQRTASPRCGVDCHPERSPVSWYLTREMCEVPVSDVPVRGYIRVGTQLMRSYRFALKIVASEVQFDPSGWESRMALRSHSMHLMHSGPPETESFSLDFSSEKMGSPTTSPMDFTTSTKSLFLGQRRHRRVLNAAKYVSSSSEPSSLPLLMTTPAQNNGRGETPNRGGPAHNHLANRLLLRPSYPSLYSAQTAEDRDDCTPPIVRSPYSFEGHTSTSHHNEWSGRGAGLFGGIDSLNQHHTMRFGRSESVSSGAAPVLLPTALMGPEMFGPIESTDVEITPLHSMGGTLASLAPPAAPPSRSLTASPTEYPHESDDAALQWMMAPDDTPSAEYCAQHQPFVCDPYAVQRSSSVVSSSDPRSAIENHHTNDPNSTGGMQRDTMQRNNAKKKKRVRGPSLYIHELHAMVDHTEVERLHQFSFTPACVSDVAVVGYRTTGRCVEDPFVVLLSPPVFQEPYWHRHTAGTTPTPPPPSSGALRTRDSLRRGMREGLPGEQQQQRNIPVLLLPPAASPGSDINAGASRFISSRSGWVLPGHRSAAVAGSGPTPPPLGHPSHRSHSANLLRTPQTPGYRCLVRRVSSSTLLPILEGVEYQQQTSTRLQNDPSYHTFTVTGQEGGGGVHPPFSSASLWDSSAAPPTLPSPPLNSPGATSTTTVFSDSTAVPLQPGSHVFHRGLIPSRVRLTPYRPKTTAPQHPRARCVDLYIHVMEELYDVKLFVRLPTNASRIVSWDAEGIGRLRAPVPGKPHVLLWEVDALDRSTIEHVKAHRRVLEMLKREEETLRAAQRKKASQRRRAVHPAALGGASEEGFSRMKSIPRSHAFRPAPATQDPLSPPARERPPRPSHRRRRRSSSVSSVARRASAGERRGREDGISPEPSRSPISSSSSEGVALSHSSGVPFTSTRSDSLFTSFASSCSSSSSSSSYCSSDASLHDFASASSGRRARRRRSGGVHPRASVSRGVSPRRACDEGGHAPPEGNELLVLHFTLVYEPQPVHAFTACPSDTSSSEEEAVSPWTHDRPQPPAPRAVPAPTASEGAHTRLTEVEEIVEPAAAAAPPPSKVDEDDRREDGSATLRESMAFAFKSIATTLSKKRIFQRHSNQDENELTELSASPPPAPLSDTGNNTTSHSVDNAVVAVRTMAAAPPPQPQPTTRCLPSQRPADNFIYSGEGDGDATTGGGADPSSHYHAVTPSASHSAAHRTQNTRGLSPTHTHASNSPSPHVDLPLLRFTYRVSGLASGLCIKRLQVVSDRINWEPVTFFDRCLARFFPGLMKQRLVKLENKSTWVMQHVTFASDAR